MTRVSFFPSKIFLFQLFFYSFVIFLTSFLGGGLNFYEALCVSHMVIHLCSSQSCGFFTITQICLSIPVPTQVLLRYGLASALYFYFHCRQTPPRLRTRMGIYFSTNPVLTATVTYFLTTTLATATSPGY